jgi:hypothetical protein
MPAMGWVETGRVNVLGKLGQVLNMDVGKVLKTDVGDIVKGAGKVLNADLGNLLRDKPDAGTAASAETRVPPAPVKPKPVVESLPELATASKPEPAFDPDATLQLRVSPLLMPKTAVAPAEPAGALPPGMTIAPNPAPAPLLNDETVTRSRRPAPQGTSLVTLLPHQVGDFQRPHARPSGELTSDPATAIYGAGGETVELKLVMCWDEEEAQERLGEIQSRTADNMRVAADRSWVLGQTPQGVVFAWTRGTYAFTASSPRGLGPLTRFLWAFPY